MENVTVERVELLAALEANRAAHQAIFDEATAGYQREVEHQLERHLRDVRAGKVKRVRIDLPVPENHTKDYDRAIRMVQMSVNDHIEIDEHSFQQYVMDDWTWKRQFLTSNSSYSAAATQILNEEF